MSAVSAADATATPTETPTQAAPTPHGPLAPAIATRAKEIISALGPVMDGVGAFARLSFHPGYHHGQIWMIKTSPAYPEA